MVNYRTHNKTAEQNRFFLRLADVAHKSTGRTRKELRRASRAARYVQGGIMNGQQRTVIAIAVLASLAGAPTGLLAQPQAPAPSPDAEEIVVTGTSIRGVAPVGSNLITVDR